MTAAGWWLCAPVRKACFPDHMCQLFRRVLATNVGANVDELWAGMRARGGVSVGDALPGWQQITSPAFPLISAC